jgi:hypothetical protein
MVGMKDVVDLLRTRRRRQDQDDRRWRARLRSFGRSAPTLAPSTASAVDRIKALAGPA